MRSCGGVDELIVQGSPLPPFDVHASLMSLPLLLGTTLDTIPATVPYLSADSGLIEQRTKQRAAPDGVADQSSADGIGDTFKSERSLVGLQAANLVVVETQGMVDEAVDGERPFLRVDGGFAV